VCVYLWQLGYPVAFYYLIALLTKLWQTLHAQILRFFHLCWFGGEVWVVGRVVIHGQTILFPEFTWLLRISEIFVYYPERSDGSSLVVPFIIPTMLQNKIQSPSKNCQIPRSLCALLIYSFPRALAFRRNCTSSPSLVIPHDPFVGMIPAPLVSFVCGWRLSCLLFTAHINGTATRSIATMQAA